MMTEREANLTRCLLRALKNSTVPLTDALLHTSMSLTALPPKPTLDEFNAVRDHAGTEGWIDGQSHQITGQMRWFLTDKGHVALRQLS